MFSPSRTALYIAIGALGFAATEANAGCKLISGTYVCASWIKGSEICEVTVDINGPNTSNSNNDPGNVQVTCEVMGGTFFDGGEGGTYACPTGALPPGDLTCSGGNPALPISPIPSGPPAPGDSNGWVIFGANGVNLSGGSTGNGPVGSNNTIALSGKSTIFGDAYADAVNKQGSGPKVTGATFTPEEEVLAPVPDCSAGGTTYSDDSQIFLNDGATYSQATGVLDLRHGSAVLDGGPFCFSNVLLGSKSTLEWDGFTTVNMTGAISGGAQSQMMPSGGGSAPLEVNSKGSAPFVFSGQATGQYVRLYAPNADIKFTGGSIFSGSVVGKSVDLGGGSQVNGTEPPNLASDPSCDSDDSFCATVLATCNANGICKATAEVNPPGLCPNGGTADFTADSFLGHVRAVDGDNGEENLWQYCTLNGNSYDCVDVPDPNENFNCYID